MHRPFYCLGSILWSNTFMNWQEDLGIHILGSKIVWKNTCIWKASIVYFFPMVNILPIMSEKKNRRKHWSFIKCTFSIKCLFRWTRNLYNQISYIFGSCFLKSYYAKSRLLGNGKNTREQCEFSSKTEMIDVENWYLRI